MTISSQKILSGVYSGDGSTKSFAVNQRFLANADLKVEVETTSTGVKVIKVLDTDYTVSGADAASGGTVDFTTAPISGEDVRIYNWPDLTQLVDYKENDAFGAETHEKALDRLTLFVQKLAYLLGGAAFIAGSWRLDSGGIPILPQYTNALRPAAGTKGRMIWNTDDGKPNFDNGSAWVLADGTTT